MLGNNKYYNIWHNITLFATNPKEGWRRFSGLYNTEEKYQALYEVFVQQAYFKLYNAIRKDTVFLDIGANIGDTAIYFAMNPNISKIYSYEPIPRTFEEAKSNISRNPFGSKIELANAGVGAKDDVLKINREYWGTGATKVGDAVTSSASMSVEVKILALKHILEGKSNVAIKSDCEGAEEFMFDDADLSNVYAIEMEYHNCKEKVVKVLGSKGFKTEDLDPQKPQGILFAWK